MSRLGKIGLFLNLALSLFFAVWGFGLYTNRMDWKAETKERADQLRKMGDARNKLLPELETLKAQYLKEDARRPILDKTYAELLESLRSGKDTPKALVYIKGNLQYDAQDLPRLGEVVDSANRARTGLASLTVLDQQYAALQVNIRDMIQEENEV